VPQRARQDTARSITDGGVPGQAVQWVRGETQEKCQNRKCLDRLGTQVVARGRGSTLAELHICRSMAPTTRARNVPACSLPHGRRLSHTARHCIQVHSSEHHAGTSGGDPPAASARWLGVNKKRCRRTERIFCKRQPRRAHHVSRTQLKLLKVIITSR
jgi:hypothetical protein